MKYFELNQSLFTRDREKVLVIDDNFTPNYPIKVRYESTGLQVAFTEDGRFIVGDKHIALFQVCPIHTPNVVINPFKTGDVVLVKANNTDTFWQIRYYSHKENDMNYCFPNQEKFGKPAHWEKIISVEEFAKL